MPQTKLEPILIVSDCHIPYHDKKAFELMLQVAKDLKPKHIYIIGDFIDFYAVSSHSKDPKRATQLVDELKAGEAALDQLDGLGATSKVYIGGNHCDRLQRYLQDKAPELFELADIPSLFRLNERGWTYVPYRQHTRRGKLYLTHDVGVSGRYAVYRCLEAFEHSVITGHTHRLAYVVEGNALGTRKLSAQFGWLGDLKQVDYMSRVTATKNWALGFGLGYMDKQGVAYMSPIPIINYRCVVNGKLYTA